MTITRQDIKILKSANVSDFDDGGGRVTAREVKGGTSNDLFLDIPETSRAYGDVDMVKVYPAVTTQDSEALLGSVFSLGRLPEDDSVNITLFTTKDWFDTRSQAIKTLESYLAPSVKIEGELLDRQLKGQQVIQIILGLQSTIPAVGKSLYIVQDEGKPTAFEQYVFVTSVSVQERTFRVNNGNLTFKVATLELSTKLDYNFDGLSATQFSGGSSAAASVRDTRVADTANYYTSKPLQEPVKLEDASVRVDNIYTQLVPSARQDKPLAGLNPSGISQAIIPAGVETTIVLPSYQASSAVSYSIGTAVKPSTLKITLGSLTLTEDSGAIKQAGVTIGFINYEAGVISWLANFTPAVGTLTLKFVPATIVPTINASLALEVTEANRGLSLAWTLDSAPLAGSVVVTYIVLGDVYTLRDQGSGVLIGADESFGVARIDYTTGDVLITFGSEPDVDSHILITWATSSGVQSLVGLTSNRLGFTTTLPTPPSGMEVEANSIVVTWEGNTATVAGSKVLGAATGTYNPKTRLLTVEPALLPAKGTSYAVQYAQRPIQALDLTGDSAVTLQEKNNTYHEGKGLVLEFNVDVSDPNIKKGTFSFSIDVRLVMNIPYNASYGVKEVTFTEGKTEGDIGYLYFTQPVSSYDETGLQRSSTQPIQVGTINYLTGAVQIVATAAQYTWWEQEFMYVTQSYGAARYNFS